MKPCLVCCRRTSCALVAPRNCAFIVTRRVSRATYAPAMDVSVRAIVLKVTDLPGAWKVGAIEPNSKSGDTQISRCLGIPNSDTAQTAYAGSPDFQRGTVTIFSQAYVFNSTAVVAEDLRGYTSPSATGCLAQLFATQTSATNVHITKAALPSTARALKGFRLMGSFDVTQGGRKHSGAFDEVALEKGRVEVSVVIIGPAGATNPAGLMDRATAAIAERLDSPVSAA